MEERLRTEQQMVRYLLGEMTIDEQIAMETGYFADPENFNMLQVVEQDLIEGYINDKLSPSGRAKFEMHFLSSPARREQVRFFKTLTRALPFEFATAPYQEQVRVVARKSDEEKTPWWEVIIAPFRLQKFALGMSFAAALLILAAAGTWMFMGGRDQLGGGQLANVNQPAPPDAGQVSSPDQPKAIESSDNDSDQDKSGSPTKSPVKPVIASFSLSIAGVRGGDATSTDSQVLRIPQNADSVQLTFNHQDEPYDRYRVALLNQAGKQIWTRGEVKVVRVKSGTLLSLNAPAKLFTQGSYIIAVSRTNSAGEWVVFHLFYIEVER
jgi:hypothetical protein